MLIEVWITTQLKDFIRFRKEEDSIKILPPKSKSKEVRYYGLFILHKRSDVVCDFLRFCMV